MERSIVNEFVVRITKDGTDFEKEERIFRCTECKHHLDICNKGTIWCRVWDRETHLYEFCSYGDGKEGTQ